MLKMISIASLIFLLNISLQAQSFSSLFNQLNELEQKLEKMINDESSKRAGADKRILEKIGKADKGGGVTSEETAKLTKEIIKIDSTLSLTIAQQDTLIIKVKKLNEKIKILEDKISKQSDDERVKELAIELKKLTTDLKKIISKGLSSDSDQREAIELGGTVSLDFAADPKTIEDGTIELGTVKLSANVPITNGLLASITLKAKENLSKVAVAEALIEWTLAKEKLTLIMGQHTYNNGLLSTHLISDPSILDFVETASPGLTGMLNLNKICPSFAIGFERIDAVTHDSLYISGSDIKKLPVVDSQEDMKVFGVFALDIPYLEECGARISTHVRDEFTDIALGTEIIAKDLTVDLETAIRLSSNDENKTSGYYVGIAYAFHEIFEAAIRYDGISESYFEAVDHRIGIGGTFNIFHGIFAALEYGHSFMNDGSDEGELAIQLGLESTLKLPGFRRKTLLEK